jgi:hypothetical protein
MRSVALNEIKAVHRELDLQLLGGTSEPGRHSRRAAGQHASLVEGKTPRLSLPGDLHAGPIAIKLSS